MLSNKKLYICRREAAEFILSSNHSKQQLLGLRALSGLKMCLGAEKICSGLKLKNKFAKLKIMECLSDADKTGQLHFRSVYFIMCHMLRGRSSKVREPVWRNI